MEHNSKTMSGTPAPVMQASLLAAMYGVWLAATWRAKERPGPWGYEWVAICVGDRSIVAELQRHIGTAFAVVGVAVLGTLGLATIGIGRISGIDDRGRVVGTLADRQVE